MASEWPVLEQCYPQNRAQFQIPPVEVQLITPSEHAAILEDADTFDTLHRKDDFFDEGIGTIFGVKRGVADIQSFWFPPGIFTPATARQWLEEWGFKPLLFVEGETT